MPEVFGWEHLTYTAVFLALAIAAIVLILKYVKTEKTLSMIMRIIGGVLFICILWNRISICVSHKNALLLIPDTFCGILLLVFSYLVMVVFEYFNVWKKQSGSDNIKTKTEEKTL